MFGAEAYVLGNLLPSPSPFKMTEIINVAVVDRCFEAILRHEETDVGDGCDWYRYQEGAIVLLIGI